MHVWNMGFDMYRRFMARAMRYGTETMDFTKNDRYLHAQRSVDALRARINGLSYI